MSAPVPRFLASLICGALFGFGLALSGMVDPAKVRGFLDVFGTWDPTLAFVLAGAVVVATIGFRLSRRRATPLLAPRFELPSSRRIDAPLLAGAALFGIGWGLSGYCPGPAVASLGFAGLPVLVFVVAMIVGMLTFKIWSSPEASRAKHALPRGEGSR